MRMLLLVSVCVFATPAVAQEDCWPNCPQDEAYRDSIWSGSPSWGYDGDGPDIHPTYVEPRIYVEPAPPPPVIYQMPAISDPKPCPPGASLSSCY